MSVRELLRGNDERFLRWRADSAPTSGRSPACASVDQPPGAGAPRRRPSARCRRWPARWSATAAHSTAPTPTWPRALAASRSPAELLDEFAAAEPGPAGLGRYFPPRLLLGDHVTHELDIVFALDREPEIRGEALTAVLNTQVALPNPFVPAFRNRRGLRLQATDAGWSHGERGPSSRVAPPNWCPSWQPAEPLPDCAATVSRCSRPGSAAGAVRPGDDLQVVTGGILEVDAAAAVVVVDLARTASPRVGPVLHAALADPAVDGVELVFGHQECVVLRTDVLAVGHLGVVEAGAVVEFTARKGPNSWARAGRRAR